MKTAAFLLTALTLLAATPPAAAGSEPVISHTARLTFDVATHSVQIVDLLEIPAGVDHLRLNRGMTITAIEAADGAQGDVRLAVQASDDADDPILELDLTRLGLGDRGGRLVVTFGGTFLESVADAVFSRENVGNEITATIGEEGIYLSSAAEWLPRADGTLAIHDLTIMTPAGFETVTQGTRTVHETAGAVLTTRWVAPDPSDGINLIANRYFVHEEPVREGVVSQTFFLEDDARLRATYMERTKAYIAMYEEMIGPYPYTKFATVENWFPTGYGMPSYTLLGSQVLRLPFIPYTSFGHEIAHNWWGNAVFVDTAEGNWCEGLTVYCADYHYKAQESPEAARSYRRTLLKDYAAYTKDAANDFPLAAFLSRHSGATRAVGYGKSMMVFHMADRMIGREAFLEGLRRVAREHNFSKAAWSDFLDAFATAGGRDLAAFGDQWLNRTGAPFLALKDVAFADDKVAFTLVQSDPAYALEVPVVVTGAAGPQEHIVALAALEQEFTLAGTGITRLAVDPDAHLFRRLHRQEIEPTISQVLADEDPVFVLQDAAAEMTAAARAFAASYAETEDFTLVADGTLPQSGRSGIIINPPATRVKELAAPELVVAGSTVFVAGKRYSLKDYDLVFAGFDPGDGDATHLVVLCDSTYRLEALARRVGHYGKYSWLLLPTGQGKVLRGNWETGDSPLAAARPR